MFDIGAAELLVIIIVAVLVIGPKDMPHAMRTAGRWIGKVRKVSSHFRTGIDAMVREAELEDMEKKWKAQNEAIMKRSAASSETEKGEPVMTGPPPVEGSAQAEVGAASCAADGAVADAPQTSPTDKPASAAQVETPPARPPAPPTGKPEKPAAPAKMPPQPPLDPSAGEG